MKLQLFKSFSHPLKSRVTVSASLGAMALVLASVLSADAAIKCEGQFQIIRGEGKLSTPYCEDNYLARIARSYGWKVSNRAVRQNPGLKARICRQIGHDYRLGVICSNHMSDRDNSWPF